MPQTTKSERLDDAVRQLVGRLVSGSISVQPVYLARYHRSGFT
jgi:hypothetical protein